MNNTQLEDTQNSLLNHYQLNQINEKLKLNGTEVCPEEIRELLSNKNAQKVLLLKAFESGWENISSEQEERFIQTIHHLAPFESSCGTISSDNMTLNRNEVIGSLNIPFPMKNQQFEQQIQKMSDPHEESVQQSSVDNSKFLQACTSKGSSLNSNKNFGSIKNDLKNGSFSFAGGTNALHYKGISRNQSHRSNQSDSIMQFNCEEFGSARNNNQFNSQLASQQQNCNNNSSRRNIYQQDDHECLTHIKETDDSIEKDYSQAEEFDIMTPEINFQMSTNRNDNLIMRESKQFIQIDGEENDGTYGQQQQIMPNNSSVYQYQQGGQNGNQNNDIQIRYLNLEQLIRSRKSSKQMSDIHLQNVQDSFCGFQSPLNVALVRNFMALNESQHSTQNQGDLNPRQLEILRELVKEEHILKTIQKSLQSQQNSSRDILQNVHLSNNKQTQQEQQCQIIQQQVYEQAEMSTTEKNIVKQLQFTFERESNDLPSKSKQIQKITSKQSIGLNTETANRQNQFSNYQNDQAHQNLHNSSLFQCNISDNNQINKNNMTRQRQIETQTNYHEVNPQQINCQSSSKQNIIQQHQVNNSINYISNDNISTKQKPNISVDSFQKKDIIKDQLQNKLNQISNNKSMALQGDQFESCDNISQCNIEGYSYRTQNSFKSNEQKKRSLSYNATGICNANNRSTSSFGFGNEDKLPCDTHFQSQSINTIPINGLMSTPHVQSNLKSSMNLSGMQYKICSSVNQENVENPIKKIRSFSQNSRKANTSTQSNAPISTLQKQNSIQNQKTLNNDSLALRNHDLPKSYLFQTSTQALEQNLNDPGQQIRLNQFNISNSSCFNTNNNGTIIIGCQFNPASNKSISEINNLLQNGNNSMNNSFYGGMSASYGDCQNVNQSFERKFRKLRSVSHQENRNSQRNSGNNILNQHLQQILNSKQQIENVQSQQNIQNCDNSLLNVNQLGQQQCQSFLNGISSVNTQFVSNTNNSQITNQQQPITNTEEDMCLTNLTDITCKSYADANSLQKVTKQTQQITCYDSLNSQKSSGFKGIIGKENFESISNRNKQNQNQIISFNSSNKMRFVTIQEQTENSNIPSMNSQQIIPINNQQYVISRQSVISQQERQSKAILTDNERDPNLFSGLKSQQDRSSYKKQEIQNIQNINQNMGRNNTYFNINNQNDIEKTQNIDQQNKNFYKGLKKQDEDDQIQQIDQNQQSNNTEFFFEGENENQFQEEVSIKTQGENQCQQQLIDNNCIQQETEYQFQDEQEETINQHNINIENILKYKIENERNSNADNKLLEENFTDFNKLIKCKNVQSISNTPLSKNCNDSNSSRIVSRINFQNQANYKDMQCSYISTLSPNVKCSQFDQGMQKSLSNSFISCNNINFEKQMINYQPQIDNISPHSIPYNISQRSNIQIMNESHIQYTSKKKLPQSSVSASYVYTPSKQISVNVNLNEGRDVLITTPYQLSQFKNSNQSYQIENQKQNQENSIAFNSIYNPNRSISTDSRVNIITNLDQSNDMGLIRKTITGIKKNPIPKNNNHSNNSSFFTSQIENQSNIMNNQYQQPINSLNNQLFQQKDENNISESKIQTEGDLSKLYQNSEQKIQINQKPIKSFSSFVQQRQKSENDQFDCKSINQIQLFAIQKNEIDQNNNNNRLLSETSSEYIENTFNENGSVKESSIYLRNKNLIEQIKQNNKDIFNQTNNSQKQNKTSLKEIEYILFNDNFKSEQKFENCNLQTIKKIESTPDAINEFQFGSVVKKQQSQLSHREKQYQQYSDNKYKRSDLKLNDSIDFNKNQSENEDNEQYYMKHLNLNLNTYLTNESQEKLKELINKAKQNQQNNQKCQNNGRNIKQLVKENQVQTIYENKKLNDVEYISINQLQISSEDSLNKFQLGTSLQQQQYSKVNLQTNLIDHKRSKSSIPNNRDIKNNSIEINQSLQDLSQQDVENMQQKNNDYKLYNKSQLFQQQSNSYQSQTFQLDTFKQQFFDQEDQDGVIINGEEEMCQNQNLKNLKGDNSQCMTETSRKDNQCLDEINSQLMYLKQRSRNMDSSIQSEINILEDKVSKIFTKIKHEKQQKSKESSFMISLNHNSSKNIQINQVGSCQQSNSSTCQLQSYTKKNASATTASNSQTSSKYITHQNNQLLNTSQQNILSQYNNANQLQPNQSNYDNYMTQNLENGGCDEEEFFYQNNNIPIDQPLIFEQPETQLCSQSIETQRKNKQNSILINQNSIMKPIINNNHMISHIDDNQNINRINQLQSCQFINNQSQIDEPYEMNDEIQSNQQYTSFSGNKHHQISQAQQLTNKKIIDGQQNIQKNKFVKYNNQQNQIFQNEQYQKKQIEQNGQNKQNYLVLQQQQFADYFEQQVHENCLQVQELLEQSDSIYSSGRSNRIQQNQAINKPHLYLQSANQQNKNNSNTQQNIQYNLAQNNYGGLTSCNTTNRSSLINNNNINTNSNHSLFQIDRQKKDLELLKIMHILEENPNNVITSIKQFETLDSQQIQNEVMLQLQSQREMEQQFSLFQQMRENQQNQNNEQEQQEFMKNQLQFQNRFLNLNQNQQRQDYHYWANEQINKNQIPVFEMSQQEWQNISASFPNNSTNNNSQFNNKQSRTFQNHRQDDFVNQEQSYDNFEESRYDQKNQYEQQEQQQELFFQRQQGKNRVQQLQNNNQQQTNDISDKENKIPEQKVNLMELLQKKQQQYQLQQKEQRKRSLQALQEQNINIQLDFNTPIISTKSNQNHQNKFKIDQAEEDQVYIYPTVVEQMNKNMRQQVYQRNNHHQGQQKQNIYHTANGSIINFTPEKQQNSQKCLSSNQISANTSKTNTAKKFQSNCSSQKILYYQNGSQQTFSDYKDNNDSKIQQRQKTHEKITQLYNQHKHFILQQEKINQEQDLLNNSSSNYWRIRNADSRKRSRNSSNSGPRSSGKEKNNSKDVERNPKYQLTEIVQFLNQQKKVNKPLLDIIKQSSGAPQQSYSQNNLSQNISSSFSSQQRQNNNKYNNNNFK